jgi:nitrogen fixation protein FixH
MSARGHARPIEEPARLKGHHVLLMLLAFFGVVFTVNGIFLASAIRSYSGIVSNEPYVKGLKYNDRIAAGERQQRLGWQHALTVDASGAISVSFADDGGRPVRGLKLAGNVGRPATNQLDRPLVLVETKPGRYVANAGALGDGTWLVELAATSGDFGPDPVYRLRRRVWLKH